MPISPQLPHLLPHHRCRQLQPLQNRHLSHNIIKPNVIRHQLQERPLLCRACRIERLTKQKTPQRAKNDVCGPVARRFRFRPPIILTHSFPIIRLLVPFKAPHHSLITSTIAGCISLTAFSENTFTMTRFFRACTSLSRVFQTLFPKGGVPC